MINDIPLGLLFFVLLILFMLSAFFSGTETALMALNRYKLKHHAKKIKVPLTQSAYWKNQIV